MQRLFIYGSLGPGRPNEHVMKNIGGEWETAAYIKGDLVEEGWGAAMGYPALRINDNGQKVHGFVFKSDHLEAHWESLDEFEGEEYERVMETVFLDDGSQVQAHVYTLKKHAS